jgi:hypothetical protein
VSWHYSIEALAVAPAPSTRNHVLSLSLLQVRTLPSRVMTSNRARHAFLESIIYRLRNTLNGNRPSWSFDPGPARARHASELIQLPTIIKVRLLGTRRQSGTVPGTVPDLAGDGDAPPSPSQDGLRFVRNRGCSPVPVPDLAGTGTLPRPRFPSGGPRPACISNFKLGPG